MSRSTIPTGPARPDRWRRVGRVLLGMLADAGVAAGMGVSFLPVVLAKDPGTRSGAAARMTFVPVGLGGYTRRAAEQEVTDDAA
jgi:hypothetical protein